MENVLEFLENTASKYPDKIAVKDEHESYTFKELFHCAQVVGYNLSSYDIKKNCVVVYAEKSAKMLGVMLGIVYAGGFYVPMDTSTPKERVRELVEDINPALIVGNLELENRLTLTFADLIKGDKTINTYIKNKNMPLYGMFTSGSTGFPKLVVINHGNVIAFIEKFVEAMKITNQDVIANQSNFDFDISVKDIYSSLITGATLEIVPKRHFATCANLLDYICERKVTTLIWSVSAMSVIKAMLGFDYKCPESITKVIFSGEVMPLEVINYWKEYLPKAMYVNVYGPTEITCNCTYYKVPEGKVKEPLPIGKELIKNTVKLVNEELNVITDTNIEGEIFVTGPTVSSGYYMNPDITAKAFVGGGYRTGDRACYNADGSLQYIGRKDNQIKRHGYRIQLEEIESAAMNVPGITKTLAFEMDKLLVLCYEGKECKELKKEIRKCIPKYMLPDKILYMENIPCNRTGKPDRKKTMEAIYEREDNRDSNGDK